MAMTLEQAWLKAMSDIIYGPRAVTADYLELLDQHLCFSFKDFFWLKDYGRFKNAFPQMRKVFFSTEDNIFGHSYGGTIRCC